jgi:hypothetical protein
LFSSLEGVHFDASSGPDCGALIDGGSVWLDQTCVADRCNATAQQSGCALDITTSSCTLGNLGGVLAGPDGGSLASTGGSGTGSCGLLPPVDGALLSLSCQYSGESCTVDLYPAVATPLFRQKTELALFQVPYRSLVTTPGQPLNGSEPFKGYAGGMVSLSDRIVVATHGGAIGSVECQSNAASLAIFVDPGTMTITATASLPSCTSRIAPDPLGDGFLAVTGHDPPSLARFDKNGRLVRASTVSGLPADLFATALLVEPELSRVDVAFSSFNSPPVPGAQLVGFDLETLAETGTSSSVRAQIRGLTKHAGQLVSADDLNGSLLVFDDKSLKLLDTEALLTARRLSPRTGVMSVHASTGILLITTTGLHAAIDVISGASPVPTALFYPFLGVPWALADWPSQPGLELVGITGSAAPNDAFIAAYDVAGGRFLPEFSPIGSGVVSAILSESNGAVFVLLSWEAKLVRLIP